MSGGIPLLPLAPLYGRHSDNFTFMLMVVIKMLPTIFEVFILIQNYAVY